MGGKVVIDAAGFDYAGPPNKDWDAPAALPIGIFLAAERSNPRVRPAIVMRPIVGRVNHDGIIGDTELIQFPEHPADIFVVSDHHVIVEALTSFAFVSLRTMSPEVHSGGV